MLTAPYEMKIMCRFKIADFDNAPIWSGLLCGVLIALGTISVVGLLALCLVLVEKISGSTGGAGGIVGFVIFPIAMLLGFPWSIWILQRSGADNFLFGIAAGLLINGVIGGLALGIANKFKKTRRTKSQ